MQKQHFVYILGDLRAILGHLEAILGHFVAILGHLRAILCYLVAILETRTFEIAPAEFHPA